MGAACWFGGYAEFLDHRRVPSGERPSQPWRMIYPRMGVVAETPCSRILAIGIASALSGSASAARQESAMNADSSGDHAGPRAISGCAVARRSKSI